MERRFVLFLVLSFAVLIGSSALMRRLNPPKPPQEEQQVEGQPPDEPADARPGAPGDGGGMAEVEQPEEQGPEPEQPSEPPAPQEAQHPPEMPAPEATEAVAREWGTLGSADPESPYRMLVTWDNRGAALERIELSSHRYRDLEDRSGYLGHLVMDAAAVGKDQRGKGCPVQVLGPGTPAALAGLEVGDLVTALDDEQIAGPEDLLAALQETRPNRAVTLSVSRQGEQLQRQITLERRPLEVIRPEADDPPSFLLTLQQVKGEGIKEAVLARPGGKSLEPGGELAGLDLWTGNWEVRESDQSHVVFARVLPELGLEITKSYRLVEVPAESIANANYKAYHLVLGVRIRNLAGQGRAVAYQLDGPTGLPAEGAWYANKISRTWGAVGLRDVAVSFDGREPLLIGCPKITDDKVDGLPWQGQPISYIGIDAQYFSCILLPQKEDPGVRLPPTDGRSGLWFAQSQPLRVGEPDKETRRRTNTSCRLVSQVYHLGPGGGPDDTLSHQFEVFAGPKRPDLLAQYDGLEGLLYYGWFGPVAKLMSWILHFFYAIVHNYGLAILMLTVMVRGLMFPLSRKQALGARKMQELQPEIKRIQERYKNDMEGRTKAQQELFRKHNYNPLSGCLVLFFQFPIFIGLYRSLMVDIELRQAPLLWEGFRWCSNLAAPDMLFAWSFMPEFVTNGRGVFGLGPYFNLLPLITVALFIMQQKLFMPPAIDEKSAQQQKIMQYMMIFIGLMFFKVASGLCVYFIASSLWGLAERKFLPKSSAADAEDRPISRAEAKAQERPRPKPAPPQALAGRDGTAAGRKKKGKPNRGKQ